jgi:hypothetical protein
MILGLIEPDMSLQIILPGYKCMLTDIRDGTVLVIAQFRAKVDPPNFVTV